MSPVEQIKERLPIAELVGSYVKLERAGLNFKARCPFHAERTPSFFVSPERGSYYCFGCGAKGDIFSFVEAFEGVDFLGALRLLAARSGVILRRENSGERDARERLYNALLLSAAFFQEGLLRQESARAYLSRRALTEKTVSEWQVGYAPDAWRSLYEYLRGKGVRDDEMLRAGVVKRSESGRLYDTFRKRITFPIFDSVGRVVAFSGRIFPEEEGVAKYLNSPETELFSKSKVLYGFDRAKFSIRERGVAVLVEGQMDLLHAHQAGTTNAVAASGTALTREQLSLLKRLTDMLILAYDGDAAGFKATRRSFILAALGEGFLVRVASLPAGEDPAELIMKDRGRWEEALLNAGHIIDVQIKTLIPDAKAKGSHALSKTVREEILPLVKALPSVIDRTEFVKRIAAAAGVRDERIELLLGELEQVSVPEVSDGVSAAAGATGGEQGGRAVSPRSFREELSRKAFGLLLFLEAAGVRQPADSQMDHAVLQARLRKLLGEPLYAVLSHLPAEEKNALSLEAEVSYAGDALRNLNELFVRLEEEAVREELVGVMDKLAAAQRAKDEGEAERLLLLCHNLSRRLDALKTPAIQKESPVVR
ncbi:MAG: DNA primase [Parcubacteria group bacterium Gr01-1014_72]|nr:MAG: DNA primase [Parcubacteria group bacterium Gr01-1014_72]